MTKKCMEAVRPVFGHYIDQLKSKSPVARRAESPKGKGLYALSEGDRYLYVGISRNLRQRWSMHTSGGPTAASLATKLARAAIGKKATYKSSGSLATIKETPDFKNAFAEARERIKNMDMRFVDGIEDDDDLAVLEIYAATALQTECNDFSTH